ncbi:hypothetical protein SYNPS1DRAFT_27604 [Syncephalis pseudoplumigaleata]|uniref:Uncharacterized protein n=1 Tax=Syncephalis pseudoplumigaleata TaxID=1712513 RepID=A0A4P9Z3V8_9FUNG|nr:hypothetical protein SYNPS1DRAFT_27604 [Syncephalis pseudoplumigaleata]|eukprot:RKP26722.1 hypothetical protein SYNPS1DRAFT_27604 [Syncephalis pseudoplumigaleata]
MTQATTRDDPLRAKSYQFWRREFLPLLQRDCLGDGDAAGAEDVASAACEQRQASVYATASAIEAIKWSCPGGIATLLDTGAFSVQCLDDMADIDAASPRQALPPPTAHVLVDGQLASYEQQLKALWCRMDAPPRHIHLWIGLPEAMQHPPASSVDGDAAETGAERDAMAMEHEEQPSSSRYGLGRWRALMTGWCKSITVEVHYAPVLMWACIGKHFYVAPSCTHVFPALDVEIEDEMAPVSNHFTETQREGLRSLGALLSVVLAELHYKGEFFVIGESAKYVARQCHRLGAYAANKTSAESGGLDDVLHREAEAAVIIVDRDGMNQTLDLVGPSWHQDNLMDQIYRVLQPPAKMCSIAHGLNEECFDLIDSLIMTGQKDGLSLFRKSLSDIIMFEDPQAKIPRSMGRVTPALLNKLLSVFQDRREQKLRHADLVELTAAVIQTLQESPKMMWDELASLEKTLSLSIGDAQQVADHLQGAVPKVNEMGVNATRMQKSYSLVDAMLLALSVYSMSGNTWQLPEDMELVLVDRWFAALLAGQRAQIAHYGLHSTEDQLLQMIGVVISNDLHPYGHPS